MQQLRIVLAAAVAADLGRLAEALAAGGRAAVSLSPPSVAPTVIVTSFGEAGIAAAGRLLAAAGGALVAAQISPHFMFAEALQARGRKVWGAPAVLIPPLRSTASFITAADTIFARGQESTAESATPPELLTTAAAALAADDMERARALLAAAGESSPLAQALSLRLKIQTAAAPAAVGDEVRQLTAAVGRLNEAEKNLGGMGAFLAAVTARLAMEDIL